MCTEFDLDDPSPGEALSSGVELNATGGSLGDGEINLEAKTQRFGDIIVEQFPVSFNGSTFTGFISYKAVYAKAQDEVYKAPLVLIYPNYAGIKRWDVEQAMFIAKLGYVGLAVDLFSSSVEYPCVEDVRNPPKNASSKQKIEHLTKAFTAYNNVLKHPKEWRQLMSLYLKEARKHAVVHPKYAAATGYCFGGQCVLEMVRNGDDIQGAVSFHGVLQSVPLKEPLDFASGKRFGFQPLKENEMPANDYNKNCKLLICNGELDAEVSQTSIQIFTKEMSMNGVTDWQFHTYSGAHHGFALGSQVWSNHYHPSADRRSSLAMINLFFEIWGETHPPKLYNVKANANQTPISPAAKI